ncbi:MAG: DUF58 domain-containing protein [Streptosporangiaceae bacterium]|nr:DUF58 domain-containing protein [Streptosporangiaceae bacterium]
MAITGRAAAVALAGVLVVLAVRNWLAVVAVAAVLLAGIAADLLLAAAIRPLVMTRSGDTRVRLGETATVTLAIVNPSRRALRAVIRDAWPPSAGAAPRHANATIPGRGQATLTMNLKPTRRGDRTAASVTVRSHGPLGLAARQGRRTVPWTVRALPPFRSRRHLPEKLARLRELDGMHRSLIRGQGSEFDSLREYVPGDDVRSIDWRGTARHQDVLVRTWRPERDRRILVVLDTGRTAAGRVGDAPRLDSSMDAALLLAALAARAGDRIDLIAFDRRIRARVLAAPRTDVLRAFTSAMAPLEAELIESDSGAMASAILTLARQRCLVVLLTDLNPAALTEGLLPHLPVLASRHVLVLGAVADPRLDALAGGRGEAAAVYGAAAAERARAERARVAAQLRQRGVTVVDASPERLPPALADAYLDLKAAGRL